MKRLYGVCSYKKDEELKHANHKYIRKYRKNGKWVYVYYQPSIDNDAKWTNEAVKAARENAMKYNTGYYFDKDNPGNIAAEKNQANMRYQRLAADARRLQEKAEENKKNEAEYNKSFQKRIDDGKRWVDNLFGSISRKLDIH